MIRLTPLFLCLAMAAFGQAPEFSFAVLTDIQYGDQATAGKRDYRKSLGSCKTRSRRSIAEKDLRSRSSSAT